MSNIAVWGGTGFNMIVIYTALRALPTEVYEAAKLDGCSELQIALRVKIPMVVPSLVLTFFFSIIATLQVFNEPMTLVLSPYGVYLGRIYAEAAVPMELVEAGRMDGAGEWRIFLRIAVPMMAPGLVTIFLFQFVAIWNNFLLPFIMLGDDEKFPMTVGLFTLLKQGASQPALYTLVITGALLAIVPLIALFLLIQRFWSLDLLSGAVKS
ncbi:sugar ABC transporter permease [Streptomyces narbonensis]